MKMTAGHPRTKIPLYAVLVGIIALTLVSSGCGSDTNAPIETPVVLPSEEVTGQEAMDPRQAESGGTTQAQNDVKPTQTRPQNPIPKDSENTGVREITLEMTEEPLPFLHNTLNGQITPEEEECLPKNTNGTRGMTGITDTGRLKEILGCLSDESLDRVLVTGLAEPWTKFEYGQENLDCMEAAPMGASMREALEGSKTRDEMVDVYLTFTDAMKITAANCLPSDKFEELFRGRVHQRTGICLVEVMGNPQAYVQAALDMEEERLREAFGQIEICLEKSEAPKMVRMSQM